MARARLPALFVLFSACDSGSAPPDSSPACMEAVDHSDLEWIQDNVFTPNCASFASCHMGEASQAGGLNLEPGLSEANLVGVESTVVERLGGGPMNLAEPGSCEASYLMTILIGEPEELIDPSVGTMPFGSPTLCIEKIDAICRWIQSL